MTPDSRRGKAGEPPRGGRRHKACLREPHFGRPWRTNHRFGWCKGMPSLALPGCDCWNVLSPMPHLGAAIDWERAAKPYRDAIIGYLEARYLPDLSRHIVTERVVDPLYFRDDLGS